MMNYDELLTEIRAITDMVERLRDQKKSDISLTQGQKTGVMQRIQSLQTRLAELHTAMRDLEPTYVQGSEDPA